METKTFDVLESRIKALLQIVLDLKRENALMATHLQEVKSALARQAVMTGRWEGERQMVRDRIESVLGELELVGASSMKSTEVNGNGEE